MDTDKNSGIDQFIFNCLQGKASKEERDAVERWIIASSENRAHYLQLKNIWDSSLDLPVSAENALIKIMKTVSPQNKRTVFLMHLQRIAAVLFIPLFLSAVWLALNIHHEHKQQETSQNTASAAFGSYSSLILPDGSKVWLNSGSRLKYPQRFRGNKRDVYLTGEAYFEVQSDTKRPFLVHTPYFSVKATGTRFNVDTYNSQSVVAVTLVEGKVSVVTGTQDQQDVLAVLRPGQYLKYDTLEHKSCIMDVDTYKYISWKDGKLVFRNDPLSEVVHKIGLQYNVDIQILDEKISKYRYRATFENQPLNELMELLKMSAPIDYKEIEPVALSDHSFSKRKIIIYSTADY